MDFIRRVFIERVLYVCVCVCVLGVYVYVCVGVCGFVYVRA